MEEFGPALCTRFGPTEYEDFDRKLSHLKQTGTVEDYRAEFERLANRVQWEEKALLGCFMGGLKESISDEMQAFRPQSMAQAIGLARLQEEKLSRRRVSSIQRTGAAPIIDQKLKLDGDKKLVGTRGVTIIKLSFQEMQRRNKRLCFNCDKLFTPGHKCKTLQVFMLTEEGYWGCSG